MVIKSLEAPDAVIRRCSVKRDVLENSRKFTRKLMCQSARLWHRRFSLNFVRISRKPVVAASVAHCLLYKVRDHISIHVAVKPLVF